jgi:hypothetical protein
VGLGAIDTPKKEEQAEEFYRRVAELARDNRTAISLFGVEGVGCKMGILKVVAERTGGDVTVQPALELQRSMRAMIDNPVVATEVRVSLFLHPSMELANSAQPVQDIGNATAATDLSFAFVPKGTPTRDEVPFQVQVRYTQTDGKTLLKVISAMRRVTTDRTEAEKQANIAALGLGAVQRAAALAEAGKHKEAMEHLVTIRRLMQRAAITPTQQEELASFEAESENLEKVLRDALVPGARVADDDGVQQVLYKMKHQNQAVFLAGARKQEVIASRRKHAKKPVVSLLARS